VAIAKQAFANMGYELVVEFFPWSRAVQNAKDPNSKYAGYFPEYHSKTLESDFVFSKPIGSGPLGFIEHVSGPVVWQSLQDLKPYTLGVVRDYLNTPEFDQAVKGGVLTVQEVTQDVQNIRKIQGRRIPLAVIDANVFQFLLQTDVSLAHARSNIQMNKRLLAHKELFVCFNASKQGAQWQKIFNQGLAQLDTQAMMAAYFKMIGFE
jgi:ABC-type amino acid transport substrate-binding protein